MTPVVGDDHPTAGALQDLEELAAISEPGPGVSRLAYSPRDAEGRDWFARRCVELGLEFEADRYGNCFGWSAGCRERPAVLIGSHLDSVPGGGRYDGALGVVCGLETARRVLDRDPAAAIAVVAFACEESARFGIGVIGSRLLLGELPDGKLDDLNDPDGVTLRDALDLAGLDRQAVSRFDPARIACFLEVHVDQGSTLSGSDAVGVVDTITGTVRTRISWTGEASHSGAHTRSRRRNALLGAARFIAAAEDVWSELDAAGQIATVTVGWLDNHPNSPSIVAGSTSVVLDLRAPDPEVLGSAQSRLERLARDAAAAGGLEVAVESLGRIEPVKMAPEVVSRLQDAARAAGIGHRVMPSMGGHDAEIMGLFVPTAMLFVANPAGVSHSPAEAITELSLEGALAMLAAVASKTLALGDRPPIAVPGGIDDAAF